MLLQDKNAVVYGGGGRVGGAVARAFAREGARVFLAGRTRAALDKMAAEIAEAGGDAETAEVDALDERAVEEHTAAVAAAAGRIDVSFNAVGTWGDVQATPMVELAAEDYLRPIQIATTAHFLTARAAARRMAAQGSGVILTLSATGTLSKVALRTPIPMGGFGVACAAIEGLTRALAGELGTSGVRVVCLRPEGIAEPFADPDPASHRATITDVVEQEALLRRRPSVREVADVAAFLASDRAGAMTGTVVNVSCGTVVD
ncbi:SDR family NAD(P)-dependent oxidoreductase [Actinomadura opuntiae]|uniref:SDR family NAD(P)-dependent oxidoreductase n=1 Tax=Actinomadura sp. OS1-43 TaxID=604315 RepID=UPI00255B1569|nr:SDR family oxidoreductase [Actinomadura sp. OS1-43]MDL4820244.1 SDR family oxidoreductase [Actinomadura sp. OS1-43]